MSQGSQGISEITASLDDSDHDAPALEQTPEDDEPADDADGFDSITMDAPATKDELGFAEPDDIRQARENGVPILDATASTLPILGAIIGQAVPLVAPPTFKVPSDLQLGVDGMIRSALGQWNDVDELEELLPNFSDAWNNLYIADLAGPTLAEALIEVNREMIREYRTVPASSGMGKHGR